MICDKSLIFKGTCDEQVTKQSILCISQLECWKQFIYFDAGFCCSHAPFQRGLSHAQAG